MSQADGATEPRPDPRDPALRRAHAVLKQRTKLAYAVPRLVPLTPGGGGDTGPVVTLRQARAARGFSTDELVRRSRVSASTIYRIEAGRTRPRPHVAHALSAALGLTPRDIVEFRTALQRDMSY